MDKQDARKLEPAAQYELRKQVIRAYRRGRNRVQISAEVGLSYPAVCQIIRRFRGSEEHWVSILSPRKRGRREGEDCLLTPKQEEAIQGLICERRPEQLKMDLPYGAAAVMQLIEREYGIRLSVREGGNYLPRRAG